VPSTLSHSNIAMNAVRSLLCWHLDFAAWSEWPSDTATDASDTDFSDSSPRRPDAAGDLCVLYYCIILLFF